MTAFTGKTGDIIKIRRDHGVDYGGAWISFCVDDIDVYLDFGSRRCARSDAASKKITGLSVRIAKVIKRTPCYVYAQVSK